MEDRNFQKKKRNEVKRKRKPVMLIAAEGKNKTEKLYFSSFQDQRGKYSIRFATGLETDPVGLLKAVEKSWDKNELSVNDGDKAYIVLDMDCKSEKIQLVKVLQKKSKNIRFIASNPCIEVWFLLHFIYTTHQFKDSKEPKKELAKYVPGYEESMDISKTLHPMMIDAKNHLEQLKDYYETLGVVWGDVECNPMTDVAEVLQEMEVLMRDLWEQYENNHEAIQNLKRN